MRIPGEDHMRLDPSIRIRECDDIYPPREDTYLLLKTAQVEEGEELLEMGCGSGMISIHMARAGAKVTAVDANLAAIRCTLANVAMDGVDIRAFRSDLFTEVRGKFDLIVFNPPYLPVDEEGAIEASWSGGRGGTGVVKRFMEKAPLFLKPGGRILVLVSSLMSEATLSVLMSRYETEVLSTEKMFFEELRVLRLRPL